MNETGIPGGNKETSLIRTQPTDVRTVRHAHELGRRATSGLGAAWALESQYPRFLDENLTTRAMPGLTSQSLGISDSLGTSHGLGPGSPLATCGVSVGRSGSGGRRAR